MGRKDTTTALVDNILRVAIVGGVLSAGLIFPNIFIALDKPLQIYLDSFDKRAREREIRRVVSYMRSRKLLSGNYKYGLVVTKKGKRRILQADYEAIALDVPLQWDHIWRIVFYDIPESKRRNRNELVAKLRRLGFYQLQRSVWVCPFQCRAIIEDVTENLGVSRYISLIEAPFIDNQRTLAMHFKNRYPKTNFK